MCDTLYRKTQDGFIFGKNSDRSPNEPNLTEWHPGGIETAQTKRCTYIDVLTVPLRRSVLLVRPAWMWGAEMGMNDAGVVIGNEAVFTKSKGKKTERLTGMDLLRLALERAGSVAAAVDVITGLLAEYGQGGNCGFDKPFYYDNSFLIAGPDGACVLETCDRDWVVRRLDTFGNISNALSPDAPFAAASKPGLEAFTRQNSEPVFTYFSQAKKRRTQACEALKKTSFTILDMMAVLRSHREGDAAFLFTKGSVGSVCMHKSALGDHTTGSLIVEVNKNGTALWITGCSTPCLALYKPVYFGNVIPPVHDDYHSALAYWLERERLVRAIYAGCIDVNIYHDELQSIQNSFIEGATVLSARNANSAELATWQRHCHEREVLFVASHRQNAPDTGAIIASLPPLWRHKTAGLGINATAPTLKERLKR
ncbi:MAG: hypothetical protein V1761_01405 [bacterium]